MPALGHTIVSEIRSKRDPDNFYETPARLVKAIGAQILAPFIEESGQNWTALDVGVGTGRFGELSGLFGDGFYGIEINKERFYHELRDNVRYNQIFWGDFLDHKLFYDVILGNPPYVRGLTTKIVRHALLHARQVVCFLLPTNFRHSKERYELFVELCKPPTEVWDLVQRPSFRGRGSYPGEYAVFVWDVPATFSTCRQFYVGYSLNWKEKNSDESTTPD